MSRKVSISVISLIGVILINSVGAQTTDNLTGHNIWQDQQINELTNIRTGGLNPTSISYNEKSASSFAKIDYHLSRGKFHALDQSGRQNDLNVYFGGLRHLGKVDLCGYLEYINTQAYNERWNSTLYLNSGNPFIIGDSILSDVTTEAFRMKAAVSYQFLSQLKGALTIGLLAGSRSDQNDPRPKTSTSVVPITAGFDCNFNGSWSIGVAQSVELYRSRLQYTIVNNLFKYEYFIMKGMGDYYGVSSGSEVWYQRDYTGTSWQTALQGVWAPKDNEWSDFLEVKFALGNQNGEDGGSSYTFKGGKYEYSSFTAQNRLQFRPDENSIHQMVLSGIVKSGDGTWSDQKRVVDTQHNNRSDYVTLSSYKIEKDKVFAGNTTYRFDLFNKGLPDLYAMADIGVEHTLAKHYTDQGWNKQEYTIAHSLINAGKTFNIGNKVLTASFGGAYYFPLGDKIFGTGNIGSTENITGAYVMPTFEYKSCKHINIKCSIDFKAPIRVKGTELVFGSFATLQNSVYMDKGEYSVIYKSKSLFDVDFGVYLNF